MGSAGLSPLLSERRRYLEQNRHRGLDECLFLAPPGIDQLHFTDGSHFGAIVMSQASVFAGMSSALQRLRNKSARRFTPLGPPHYPIATVLDDNEYLVTTYTDSLVRACLLRAAMSYELNYTDGEAEKTKSDRASNLLCSQMKVEHDISAEIILAALAENFHSSRFKLSRCATNLPDLD